MKIPGLCRFHAVFFAELVDPACRIYDFLLPGIKRVTTGADFHVQIFPEGRTGFKRVSARAGHVDFCVVWVDIRFHGNFPAARA